MRQPKQQPDPLPQQQVADIPSPRWEVIVAILVSMLLGWGVFQFVLMIFGR